MRRGAVLAVATVLSLAAAPALAEDQRVTARNDFFDPRTVTINVGEKVTWTNTPGGFHNVKFDGGEYPDRPENPDPSGWTVEQTFDRPGEFRYYCEAHGNRGGVGMAGTVIVRAPGQAPPADTTAPAITNLRARPSTACARRSRRCRRTRTTFRFTLSEAATVRGAVRKRGERTRRFEREGVQGSNAIRFSTRRLDTGRWRLRLTATDAAGNTSPRSTVSFRVRR